MPDIVFTNGRGKGRFTDNQLINKHFQLMETIGKHN